MKVLYAIQGTGNGHLSRAQEIVPLLSKYVDTTVLVSGNQSQIQTNFDVNYQKTGLTFLSGKNGKIDLLRTCLNKLTDKNYNEQIEKIVEIFEELINNDTNEEDILKVGNSIFDIASNNRFFSKMYADLYALLIKKFEIMKVIFENSNSNFFVCD
jgi:predicted transcriptional regulator